MVSGVAGKEAEEGPEAGRPPGVLFELEEDVPESALMADGGQVMPRGGGRWRWVGRRCIHMSRISEIGLVLNQFRHFPWFEWGRAQWRHPEAVVDETS